MPLGFKKPLKGHFLQQKRAKFKFSFDQDTIIRSTCHMITTARSEMSWLREGQLCTLDSLSPAGCCLLSPSSGPPSVLCKRISTASMCVKALVSLSDVALLRAPWPSGSLPPPGSRGLQGGHSRRSLCTRIPGSSGCPLGCWGSGHTERTRLPAGSPTGCLKRIFKSIMAQENTCYSKCCNL